MKFELDIDGEKVSISDEDLIIKDAQLEAPKAASKIFYWGSVAAAIRSSLEKARADYRHIQAKSKVDALTREPKIAEWKVTAAFESTEQFRQAKNVIEHWRRLNDQAQAIYQAYLSRASTIQTIYNYETSSGGKSFANMIGNEEEEKKEKTDKLRKVMRKKRG